MPDSEPYSSSSRKADPIGLSDPDSDGCTSRASVLARGISSEKLKERIGRSIMAGAKLNN
jgi:hypothetical protein